MFGVPGSGAHRIQPRSGATVLHPQCSQPYTVLREPWRGEPRVFLTEPKRCDTNISGQWVRFLGTSGADALPTSPWESTGGISMPCSASCYAWVAGWPAGSRLTPPETLASPGSYPGDGPLSPSQFVLCFDTLDSPPKYDPALPLPLHWNSSAGGELNGGALWEHWSDIGARNELSALINNPNYPSRPTERRIVSGNFAAPEADDHDEYGTRISGIFVAPMAGEYVFLIASDDNGALYVGRDPLNTGGSAHSMELIAHVPQWTDVHQWDKFPEQRSAPFVLRKGEQLLLVVLQKEGRGGDHVSVGSMFPDGRKMLPLPIVVPRRTAVEFPDDLQQDYYVYTVGSMRRAALLPTHPPRHNDNDDDASDGGAFARPTCQHSVNATVIHCGGFLLWALPNAPVCPMRQWEVGGRSCAAYCTVASGLFE